MRKGALVIAALALVAACRPTCRMGTWIEAPAGMTITSVTLHLQATVVDVDGVETQLDVSPIEFTATPRGVDVTTHYRGSENNVILEAWLDANGNGRRDVGDAIGRIAPVTLADKGLCLGNFKRSETLVLARVTEPIAEATPPVRCGDPGWDRVKSAIVAHCRRAGPANGCAVVTRSLRDCEHSSEVECATGHGYNCIGVGSLEGRHVLDVRADRASPRSGSWEVGLEVDRSSDRYRVTRFRFEPYDDRL